MSRIGKKEIEIPAGVTVTIEDRTLQAKGSNGMLSLTLPAAITAEVHDNSVVVGNPKGVESSNLHGLSRTLVANVLVGVSVGFSKSLELSGVGYRASVSGR